MIDCRTAQARLERAFVTQRWSELADVHAHLHACPRCRRTYERIFAAERALAASEADAATSAAASARLSPSEQALLLSRALPPPARAAHLRRDLVGLVGALSAAAMVVAAALWLPARFAARPSAGPSLAARGHSALDAARAPLGLRALCLEGAADELSARSLGTEPLHGVRPCDRDSALGFTVRNETGAVWYLQVVLVAADGAVLRAFPADESPAEISPADDEQPLPGSTPLAGVIPGRLEVFALFSPSSSTEDLLAAVRAQRADEIRRGGGYVLHFAVEVAR